MKYEEITKLSKEEIEYNITDPNAERRSLAVLSVSLFQGDWRYAQSICIKSLSDINDLVVRSGLYGLSHIVRIHRKIDMKKLDDGIEPLLSNERFYDNLKELKDDIDIYLNK